MIVLSGGTGTPKLLTGLKEIVDDLCVIVNTAEDVWVSGNKVCPDIDSVIYALAGIVDETKWWGIRNDTFITHDFLLSLGFDEKLMIGDRDRATHILRSEMLRNGFRLTEATKAVAEAYGVRIPVLPMCEEEVETIVVTTEGEMHFQEFWVVRKGEPDILDVYFRGIEKSKLTDEIRAALKEHDEVLIGPSNPITSILPILSIEDFAEKLESKKVVAVSPIVGNRPFSGPAGKFMMAKGYEVSPTGVLDVYSPFLDVLVIDSADKRLESEKMVATSILMKTKDDSRRLAEFILKVFDRI
jgi:LPPG:FO 2-phospho-L-lactate transferase